MDLEQRLDELAGMLSRHVAASTILAFRDFLAAGEYGVALEFICDRLSDDEKPVTVAEFGMIRDLAAAMGLDRPSIDDVAHLVMDAP